MTLFNIKREAPYGLIWIGLILFALSFAAENGPGIWVSGVTLLLGVTWALHAFFRRS